MRLRAEFRPMFQLAAPVVVAELGWMAMGVADTLMVGPISAEAIGAVGLGSALFMAVAVFAMGMLLGLDTLVSQAYGAGRIDECHRWLVHGIALAAVLTPPVMGALFLMNASLPRWGLDPAVLALTQPYLGVVAWSVPPLLLYFAFRRYLQGLDVARQVMIALILANLMNACVNWVLIYGKLGAPALGVAGAAWATVLSRAAMALYLLVVIVHRERGRRPGLFETPLRIEARSMRQLVELGVPAALQLTLEVGVFGAASALAGRLAPAALAAHQIALNLAGVTFMVPLGIASAGAVRVGHAVGRLDAVGAASAGWTALLFGAAFMSCSAIVFVVFPRALIGAFTTDPAVLEVGVSLLAVAAVFQLFDGLQVVGTGVLRGVGDTRTPMIWNLAAHWGIGLPIAYVLAFHAGLGVIGLWWGLSAGLIICGIALLSVWRRRTRSVLPLLMSRAGGAMAEQKEPPRPHGDPLDQERLNTEGPTGGTVDSGTRDRQTLGRGYLDEPDAAQRQSDAINDVVAQAGVEQPTDGGDSTANGVPELDDAAGKQRRKLYDEGAEFVSKID
jgi:multidrug resistance protein, MATE family